MESSSPAASSSDDAPSVSSSLADADPGEIALSFEGQNSSDVRLSRVDALRLAARLRQVAEANRSVDRKLAAFQRHLLGSR